MKKLTTLLVVASVCLASFGRPGPVPRGPMPGPRIHHAPPPPAPRHHHHHGAGPFWAGVGVGLAGSLLAPVIAPPPPPRVHNQAAPQRVWVPPVYGERPVYRAGIYVGTERYIMTPGYWTTSY